jgi:hypothetical protein
MNSKYTPENNYLETNYTPIRGFDEDMCSRCVNYYSKLYSEKKTKSPFPPNCQKHMQSRISYLNESDFENTKEYEDAVILLDPISWAYSEFGWTPRWYQSDMLSCSAQKKLYRCGRRIGKSEALVVETLYLATTAERFTTLVIAPYERQVTRLFDEMEKFINVSVSLKGSISRYTKTPSRIDFNNGSKILGFSAGATSASGSDKIRGQDAHLIIIDEIDTLADADIDAVMAILASHKECRLIAATTPRGWRRRFFTYATDKDLGFKEFWFISAESPEWDESTEKFFRGSVDATTYAHEYLADFAELEEGVFKARQLNAAISDYDMDSITKHEGAEYILGVDWNKSAGTHMVILEWYNNRLKLAKKIIVDESAYTQTDSVQLIISLNRQWRFKYIFVDAGYGSVQTELLRKHTLSEPSSRFDEKLHAIHMNQHIDVIDPLSGEKIKRFAKPFLIDQTKKLLDDGYLILPRSEDTNVNADSSQLGLIQQMRNFRIDSISVYGLPRYSQGQDHTLTAYYLACGGFFWKEGDLKQPPYLKGVVGIEVSDTVNPEKTRTEIEREQMARSGWKLTNSSGKVPTRKSLGRDLDSGRSNFGSQSRKNIGNKFNRKSF